MSRKLIVLTGATRGLGRALVSQFVGTGHVVIGCGRSAREIAELTKSYPGPNRFQQVDVTDRHAVDAWAVATLESSGPPDLLINNAAVMNEVAKLWEIPADSFDRTIDVNIKGVANVLRAFLPPMVRRGSGVIVNLSSGWGRTTAPEVAPYCATKYAIEGLTLALAQELPPGMAAIPLNPGIIDTDMLRQAWSDGASAFPKAEDWAKTAAPFLLKLGPAENGKSLSIR